MPLLETRGSGSAIGYGLNASLFPRSSSYIDASTLVYIPFDSDLRENLTGELPTQNINNGIQSVSSYNSLRLDLQKTAYASSKISEKLAPLNGATNWTVEYWAYVFDGGNSLATEIELGRNTYYTTGLLARWNAGTGTQTANFYWRGNEYNSVGSRTHNSWIHVAIVGQSGTLRHYVNGSQVGTASPSTGTGFDGNPEGFWLGGSQHTDPAGPGQTANMAIRKLRISNVARYQNGSSFTSSSVYPIGQI